MTRLPTGVVFAWRGYPDQPMNPACDTILIGRKHCLLLWLAVGLMLVIHGALALSAASTKSATFDEPLHLIGGVSYWRYNDFRIQPENGNLAQRVIGLPNYLLTGVPEGMEKDPGWRRGSGFHAANTFLFGQGVDHELLVLRGRAMVVLASVLLGLVVFLVSRRLWGNAGGLLSLGLYAFHPAVLANAGLMTSDIIASLFFVLSVWALWHAAHRLTAGSSAGLILAGAGLALSKFSFPVFFPMAGLMLLVLLARNKPWAIDLAGRRWTIRTRGGRLAASVGLAAIAVVGVVFLVWAAYGFRYQAMAPGLDSGPQNRLFVTLEETLAHVPRAGGVIAFFAQYKLLPEAFLCGMAYVLKFSDGRGSLALGQFSLTGVWWFYPVTLFFKTTLVMLAVACAGLLLGAGRLRDACRHGRKSARARRCLVRLYRISPWLILVLVYMAVAMNMGLNIGVRHVLPVAAGLAILLGFVPCALLDNRGVIGPRFIRRARLGLVLVCLLVAAQAGIIWPNYISYFNRLAGPSDEVYRRFSDSNLDWGQDLPGLREWADNNGYSTGTRPDGSTLFFTYFGSARARAYGVPGTYINCFFAQPDQAGIPVEYLPGDYAISVTRLTVLAANWGPGWNQLLESAYVERRDFFRRFFSTQPNSPQRAQVQGELSRAQIGALLQEFEELRFARFCVFLRQRRPDAQINQTINIYRVSREQLEQYFYGPAPASDGYEPVIR